MIKTEKFGVLRSICVEDVAMADRPDFSDAWLSNGFSLDLDRWLTDDELEQVPADLVQEFILENLDLYN